jgi:hypothetical protein
MNPQFGMLFELERLRRKYFPSIYVGERSRWGLIAATSDCEQYGLKHVIPTDRLEPGYIYLWMSTTSTTYKARLDEEARE